MNGSKNKWEIDYKKSTMKMAGRVQLLSGLLFGGLAWTLQNEKQKNLWLGRALDKFFRAVFQAMGKCQVEAEKINDGKWI